MVLKKLGRATVILVARQLIGATSYETKKLARANVICEARKVGG